MKKAIPILVLLLFSIAVPATAQQESVSDSKGLIDAINILKADNDLIHGAWSIHVMNVASGRSVAGHNIQMSLMPASVMKTITSSAALGILGPESKIETSIEYDGELDELGVLHGNLYIKGGGDPTLGAGRIEGNAKLDELLSEWVEGIQAAGIKKIQGAIIGDAQIFEDAMLPPTWQWGDLGNYYAAGACGLSINEDKYYVFFRSPEKSGSATSLLRIDPHIPDLNFINEVISGPKGSGDNAYIFGAPYTNLRYIRGSIPPGRNEFSIKGSIPEPALFAAKRLERKLWEANILPSKPSSTVRQLILDEQYSSKPRKTIHVHQSPELKEIVYWLNKKSVNLFAEHLLKLIGLKVHGRGTNEDGAKAIISYWKEKGIAVDGFHIADGSGLSRFNGVSTSQLTSMLQYVANSDHYEVFHHSLPIAGDPQDIGSLSNLCKGTLAQKNLCAKSGYIGRVRGYAGYVKDKSGDLLCFAMLANNYTCSAYSMKKKFEKLMIQLAELE